jgi:hypothetical protein
VIRPSDPLSRRRKNLRVRSALLLARLAPGWCSRQLRRPVFVVGCARSGTTLLAGMLGTHPQIAEWSEVNYVWDPGWYPWRPEFADKLPLEVDAAAFQKRWWRENRHRRREISAAFGAYQALEHRPVLVNKSPFHTFRIPRLLELFPDARFIHVVRDGRAVAHSYAGHLLRKGKLREWPAALRARLAADPEELALHTAGVWSRCLHEVEARDRELGLRERGLLFETSYERLVAEPAATLVRLHRFLAVEPWPGAADAWVLRNQNHKWRSALSADTRRQLAERLAADLDRRGYAP